MSDYTQITDFSAKDALASGDPEKTIIGADVDAELAAISTAVATKADDSGVVHKSGTETIAGNKTLSGSTVLSGTASMSSKSMYWSKGADIASAATLVLGTDGNMFDVTGSTGPITAITVPAGMLFMLQFDSTPTLTHHATNLNLPGGANIVAEAGDRLIGFATAANTVHVLDFIRAVSPPGGGWVIRTPTATTSGSTSEFTSIPPWVTEIVVMLAQPSTNGTAVPRIQIGEAGGYLAAGYACEASDIAAAVATTEYTTGFGLCASFAATDVPSGSLILNLYNASTNTWVISGVIRKNSTNTSVIGGYASLSSVLTKIQLITTDTFDAGAWNIKYRA